MFNITLSLFIVKMLDHRLGHLKNVFVGALLCKAVNHPAISKDWHMIVGQLVNRIDGLDCDGDGEATHETATVSRGDSEDAKQPETHEDTEAVPGEPGIKVRAKL